MNKLTREQLARMSPEARERYEIRLKKVQRNRKILTGFIALVVVASIGAVLSMTVLFNISSIKVAKKGNYYTEKEILSASGLDVGKNIIRTNFDDAQKRIETMLPYVLTANIQKSLSGTVTITITDNKASMIFAVKNGYALADANGKVLELLPEEPENSKYMVLTSSQELTAKIGEYIGFADEKEEKLYTEICSELKNSGLYEHITALDISQPTNIKIIYENRMRIKIGDTSNLNEKFTAAAKTIDMENETNPNTIAEINVSILKKVYVNPLDTLEEKEPVEEPEKETTEVSDEEAENEEKLNEAEDAEEIFEDGNEEEGDTDKGTDEESENEENMKEEE